MHRPRLRLCTLLILVALAAPALLLFRAIQRTNARTREAVCRGNGFYLGAELMRYRSSCGRFPPLVAIGPDGRTPRSWRTVLFAFVDQGFGHRYDPNRPWDSPHNLAAAVPTPRSVVCPNSRGGASRFTNYLAIVRPGSDRIGSGSPRSASDPEPLLVEAPDSTIPWTKPEDIALADLSSLGPGHDPGGLIVLFSDGSTRRLDRAQLEALAAEGTAPRLAR